MAKGTQKTGYIVEFMDGMTAKRGHVYHGERNAKAFAEQGKIVVHEVDKNDCTVYETNRRKIPVVHIKDKADIKQLGFLN